MIQSSKEMRGNNMDDVFKDPPRCQNCVLSKYCTRKNIYRNDGFCRLDGYDESELEDVLTNSLWLAGDARVQPIPDVTLGYNRVTLTEYLGMPVLRTRNGEEIFLEDSDMDAICEWLGKFRSKKDWLKNCATHHGQMVE